MYYMKLFNRYIFIIQNVVGASVNMAYQTSDVLRCKIE